MSYSSISPKHSIHWFIFKFLWSSHPMKLVLNYFLGYSHFSQAVIRESLLTMRLTKPINVSNVVVHGSVLGPLMFILFINDIVDWLPLNRRFEHYFMLHLCMQMTSNYSLPTNQLVFPFHYQQWLPSIFQLIFFVLYISVVFVTNKSLYIYINPEKLFCCKSAIASMTDISISFAINSFLPLFQFVTLVLLSILN